MKQFKEFKENQAIEHSDSQDKHEKKSIQSDIGDSQSHSTVMEKHDQSTKAFQ